jgi:hypothetical protein
MSLCVPGDALIACGVKDFFRLAGYVRTGGIIFVNYHKSVAVDVVKVRPGKLFGIFRQLSPLRPYKLLRIR